MLKINICFKVFGNRFSSRPMAIIDILWRRKIGVVFAFLGGTKWWRLARMVEEKICLFSFFSYLCNSKSVNC